MLAIGLSENAKKVIEEKKRASKEGGLEIDYVFITRQLLEIVINPWTAYEIGRGVVESLLKKHSKKQK